MHMVVRPADLCITRWRRGARVAESGGHGVRYCQLSLHHGWITHAIGHDFLSVPTAECHGDGGKRT